MTLINRVRRLPKKIIQAISYQHGTLFGQTNYERFAVIGNARTGSNFLLDGITSSRSVYMFHEIFADHNRKIGTNFEHIISNLYKKKRNHIKHVGVKIFYYHLTEDEWSKFLSHEDFKIIHLIRVNRLRTIISLEIALKTNQWVATPMSEGKTIKEKTVRINPGNLIEKIQKIGEFEQRTRDRFKKRKFLEIKYEDLAANPKEEFNKILIDFIKS